MRHTNNVRALIFVLFSCIFSINPAILPAQAQPIPTPSEGFDISGMWSALVLEDWYDRLPGAGLGEYTGIPMNDAARQKAETWDASILSQPERQAQPHPAQYSFRGPRPNLSIDRIVDPVTREHIGYRTYGTFGNADRTIWLDGRAHPSEPYGLHQWNGFSTGEWVNGMLVVTTTHMKYGVYQRNGVPASPYALMTEFWFRNGEYLTMVSHIEDPIYLEEPLVRSQTWIWNPPQVVDLRRPFEPVEEVAMEPGWVPHWPLGTKHTDMANRLGIAVEATTGGSVTIYPEYRETLRQMREEFDNNRASQ
jgi:hypothetical protein